VAQFAKKTGDYAAISKTDLRLIALTHMLEIELNGKKYLNEVSAELMALSSPSASN
jgi:RNA-binding protein NOB1